jgi:hypothetical protein
MAVGKYDILVLILANLDALYPALDGVNTASLGLPFCKHEISALPVMVVEAKASAASTSSPIIVVLRIMVDGAQ